MLQLVNVTAGYGDQIVLRDVSLTVPDGSVVALLGPNGAGKTTLLRVASGVLKPRSGQVLFDGVDITGWSPDRRARAGVGHVPEGRGVFAALDVAANLRVQSRPGTGRDGIEAAMTAFPRLRERRQQLAGTLSGGEQQMLALARAYVDEPEVVLLDEVSMGLAPRVVDEIYRHLEVLAEKGQSLLLVEQYVARALWLADYVYALRDGRIVLAAEPDEVGEDVILASYLGEAS